jgi:hypothetical protein
LLTIGALCRTGWKIRQTETLRSSSPNIEGGKYDLPTAGSQNARAAEMQIEKEGMKRDEKQVRTAP